MIMPGSGDSGAESPADYTASAMGTLTFIANDPSETISITIIDDQNREENETFTVVLSNPRSDGASTPALYTSGTTATITIVDDDLYPILSITSAAAPDLSTGDPGTGVTEGLSFQFSLISDIPIPGVVGTDKLALGLVVTDEGGTTGATIVEALEIGAGKTEATFTVTMNSLTDVGSTPVSITVTLNDTNDYDTSSDDSFTVSVKDNDAPSAAIPLVRISNSENYIVEGGTATFTVTASESPNEAKNVNVVFSVNNADFIAMSETNLMKTPRIPATGDPSATVSLTTKADDPDGDDYGVVTATLMDGAGYVLSSTASERVDSVVVLDELPEISIAAIDPVNEADGMFTVTLESDIDLVAGNPITITSLTVVDANVDDPQYNPQISTSPIQIPSADSNNSVNVVVTFTKDPDYEGWDDLTVSLAEVANDLYTVNTSANSRTVEIREEQEAPISIALEVPTAVTEGRDIVATLTATSTSSTQQTIMVDLQAADVTGTYLNYTNSLIEIMATANSTTEKTVMIPTSEVATSTAGSISVVVLRGDGYETASTTPTTVSIRAIEELPVVALKEDPSSVTRGHSFTFLLEVTSGTVAAAGLPVTFTMSDSGSNVITGIQPGTYSSDHTKPQIVIIPQSGSQIVTVTTTEPTNTADQDITINLAPEAGDLEYQPSNNEFSAMITSRDNSIASRARPRLSIASDSSSTVKISSTVTEVSFTITASHEPNSTLSFNYIVSETESETGNEIANFISSSFVKIGSENFPDTGITTKFTVPIVDPTAGSDPKSDITVTLVDGADYTIADSPGHQATVGVTDSLSIISITSAAAPDLSTGDPGTGVTEGLTFNFTVTSDEVIANNPLEIHFTSSYTGGGTDPNVVIQGTTVSIPVGQSTATGTVLMDSGFDIGSTDDVKIVIAVMNLASYDVNQDASSIEVAVKDNDAPDATNPIITITRAADYIVEGGDATFTLTSTGAGGTAVLPSADKVS